MAGGAGLLGARALGYGDKSWTALGAGGLALGPLLYYAQRRGLLGKDQEAPAPAPAAQAPRAAAALEAQPSWQMRVANGLGTALTPVSSTVSSINPDAYTPVNVAASMGDAGVDLGLVAGLSRASQAGGKALPLAGKLGLKALPALGTAATVAGSFTPEEMAYNSETNKDRSHPTMRHISDVVASGGLGAAPFTAGLSSAAVPLGDLVGMTGGAVTRYAGNKLGKDWHETAESFDALRPTDSVTNVTAGAKELTTKPGSGYSRWRALVPGVSITGETAQTPQQRGRFRTGYENERNAYGQANGLTGNWWQTDKDNAAQFHQYYSNRANNLLEAGHGAEHGI